MTWRDPAPGVPPCPVCDIADHVRSTKGDVRGRLWCRECWLFFNGGQREWEAYETSRATRALRLKERDASDS